VLRVKFSPIAQEDLSHISEFGIQRFGRCKRRLIPMNSSIALIGWPKTGACGNDEMTLSKVSAVTFREVTNFSLSCAKRLCSFTASCTKAWIRPVT